jgi:hypothetical protein
VALNQEMVQTLDEIRAGAESALYGATPAQADELFKKHLASMIVGSGIPVLQVMHYQWFLRELARIWRTREGRDLAFHLELCIRKWVGLGLEPRTVQFLICEAHQRLKGENPTTKTRRFCSDNRESAIANRKWDNRQGRQDRQVRPEPEPQHCSTGAAAAYPRTLVLPPRHQVTRVRTPGPLCVFVT